MGDVHGDVFEHRVCVGMGIFRCAWPGRESPADSLAKCQVFEAVNQPNPKNIPFPSITQQTPHAHAHHLFRVFIPFRNFPSFSIAFYSMLVS